MALPSRNDAGDLHLQAAGAYNSALGITVKGTSGYVGIGTTVPSQNFDVYGGGLVVRGGRTVPTYGNGFVIDFGGMGGANTASLQGWDYGVGTSRSIVMQPAGGNVGIGTTSPHGTLTISGTNLDQMELGNSGALPVFFLTADGASGYLDVNRRTVDGAFANASATHSRIQMSSANAAGYISFATTDTNNIQAPEVMRISGNGYVGIGTTSPAYTLTVWGHAAISDYLYNVGNTSYPLSPDRMSRLLPMVVLH